jgi:hypothetical protein
MPKFVDSQYKKIFIWAVTFSTGKESENRYLRNLLEFMDYTIVFFINSVEPSFAELHYF